MTSMTSYQMCQLYHYGVLPQPLLGKGKIRKARKVPSTLAQEIQERISRLVIRIKKTENTEPMNFFQNQRLLRLRDMRNIRTQRRPGPRRMASVTPNSKVGEAVNPQGSSPIKKRRKSRIRNKNAKITPTRKTKRKAKYCSKAKKIVKKAMKKVELKTTGQPKRKPKTTLEQSKRRQKAKFSKSLHDKRQYYRNLFEIENSVVDYPRNVLVRNPYCPYNFRERKNLNYYVGHEEDEYEDLTEDEINPPLLEEKEPSIMEHPWLKKKSHLVPGFFTDEERGNIAKDVGYNIYEMDSSVDLVMIELYVTLSPPLYITGHHEEYDDLHKIDHDLLMPPTSVTELNSYAESQQDKQGDSNKNWSSVFDIEEIADN